LCRKTSTNVQENQYKQNPRKPSNIKAFGDFTLFFTLIYEFIPLGY